MVFLDEPDAVTEVSYADLDRAARRIGETLAAQGVGGEPVLLLYPPGRAYVEGFLGCLYAGAIAVPAYPPDPARLARTLPRLRTLVADCGARLALTLSDLADALPAVVSGLPELDTVRWLATDTLPADAGRKWTMPAATSAASAVLQYTSGSTGAPKGVLLSHANLTHNAELVRTGFGTTPESVGVSWLPPYHDMGLFGGIVQPLYTGLPVVLMSPLTFLQRPLAWLEAISRYRATASGGPNFAFDLCVRKTTEQQRAALDLSSWSVAFCGAEPVRQQTLDRFAEAFKPAGFDPAAFYPCYGLAEATLIVTGGRPDMPPKLVERDGVRVGCGSALGDQHVAVVDPRTRLPRPAGEVGEIWVCGPSVAQGYWNQPELSEHTFRARRADEPARTYLRTGDLGFLDHDGELVVTGRVKDLIIVRGRNVYPQDLEHAVEQRVGGVRPGCSAAFAVEGEDTERVVVVAELAEGWPADRTMAEIRQAVTESAEISLATVVLLRARTIPKTSSGKIQRHACREALTTGAYGTVGGDVLARWDERSSSVVAEASAAPGGGMDLVEAVASVSGLVGSDLVADTPLTRLGLDSLRAVELRHLLVERFGLDVTVSELLSGATVADLLTRARPASHGPDPTALAPTPQRPATDGERALWFLQRWSPDSAAYQITRAARIHSDLDTAALTQAVDALVDRHPALRTRLASREGEPECLVDTRTSQVLVHHDATGWDERRLRDVVERDAARGFDLERGPLLRLDLYSRGPADHVLLISIHHVIADFWSLSVLVDELLALYAAQRSGTEARLARPHTAAQPPADHTKRLAYWRDQLAGAPATLDLPTDRPRPRLQSFRGASHEFRLAPEVVRGLDQVAARAGTTRFVALVAGYAALLSRYGGADDVLIGAPTAGRDDPRSTHTVGYLVDPVPLRIRISSDMSFHDLVARVRTVVLDALDNVVPFARLVETVRPVRDPGRPPLVQTMVTLQQAPPGRADLAAFAVQDNPGPMRLAELEVTPFPLPTRGAAFDLSLMAAEVAGGLSCSLEYCADLFRPDTVARLGAALSTLLASAAATPDQSLAALELVDPAHRADVLTMGAARPGAEPQPLPDLLAQQASRRPHATALVCRDTRLTYAELDARAGRLAALLRDRFDVRRSEPVGVLVPRGVDRIVAFWAALYSGGAYLPLEPALPPARLAWMTRDARPSVVLTHRALVDTLPADGPRPVLLDDPDSWADAAYHRAELTPGDLAYILYTSGSTGRPKGVLVPHRGLRVVVSGESARLGLTESSRVLQFASCAYDVSVDEILLAHLNGAELHVTPPGTEIPGPALVRYLTEQRVTAMVSSPSVFAALPDADLPDLEQVLVGGEVCPNELVSRWGQGRTFLNAYGPTEATICVTVAACTPQDGRPAIGPPLPGISVYVLDARLEPVPVGMPGEMFLGGPGIAWGYLGQPARTAELFLPDPFTPVPGARMYRTGDRARWLPDGSLDFLGRYDDQVQIGGVRVEPGETEARLRELLGIHEVAVVARPARGGVELVAYLVAAHPRPTVAELRAMLRAELPEPWVPAAFVYLDQLPLNASDKLDRAALPAPGPADRGVTEHLAPRTALETTVAQVWAEVLDAPAVGVRDHFFDELGGSSLLVAKVTSALGERLGRDIPVTHLFEYPTVESLASHLAGDRTSSPEQPPDSAAEDQAAARRAALARRTRTHHGPERGQRP